ncbi:DUF1295-domain-containing protein [Exidia glandulosa HHB12029]|uniref:DUF1295-domain-containing protein n=1 Tax=Exidia glandulosa HHB12029 TaxID=1314781 RepID=A0A165PXW6_EXIGL|nr:DUF1295-domain-containing protein [Exidia glandulosa HHB12029]
MVSTVAAFMDLVPPALRQPVYFLLFNCAWTYVVSEITDNVSQVDRVWSFLPTLYTAYYALAPSMPWAPPEVQKLGTSNRAVLMFGLQLLWTIRLTYNAHRRGFYSSLKDEDYRWVPLRQAMPGILFKVFNLFFIAIAQNILLFILGLPTHDALTLTRDAPLNGKDYLLAGTSIVLLAIEFVADNQQYAFQTWKHSGAPAGVADPSYAWPGARIAFTESDRKRGFMTKGLWGWTRHPNFACEQSFWIVQTFIPLLSTPHPHPSLLSKLRVTNPPSPYGFLIARELLPALAIVALFYSSTLFTEKLSAEKYPGYAAYQSRVGMFVPTETVLRGWVLALRGKKEKVDAQVWGEDVAVGDVKKTQ